MLVIENIADLRRWNLKNKSTPRALVPTMGALHAGHLSLCDRAREAAGKSGHVVTTIFVNPTQFGPNEDLAAYPRTLDSDLASCQEQGVDLVFAPRAKEIYFPDTTILIHETRLSLGLCGHSRPGHFDGVCNVVAKLFNLIQPHWAVFGEKDYQQLAVIRRLVRDLNFPIEIIESPTVREKDGLAMSSRNTYLTPDQRAQAPIIHQSLREVRDAIVAKKITHPAEAETQVARKISQSKLAKIDYVKIVHPTTLEPLESFGENGFRIITAVFFGKTRLIDNLGIDT